MSKKSDAQDAQDAALPPLRFVEVYAEDGQTHQRILQYLQDDGTYADVPLVSG